MEHRIFLKELTPAEAGETKTHESYIRLPNNFDYETFFQQKGEEIGSIIQINLNVSIQGNKEDICPIKFVYYINNTNQEKRIPSLRQVYEKYGVSSGCIVRLSSETSDGKTNVDLSFIKSSDCKLLSSSPILYYINNEIEQPICNLEEKTTCLQVIYYGAPGTGKSYKIKSLDKNGAKPIRTTFHPDSDYSTFVGAYKPSMERFQDHLYTKYELIDKLNLMRNTGITYVPQKFGAKYWRSIKQLSVNDKKDILQACGMSDNYTVEIDKGMAVGEEFIGNAHSARITYQFIPQAFLKAYVQAWKNYPTPQYLVIEEINRGNCAQIFGDLFQLLDRSSRGFSEYPIAADSDVCKYLCETFADEENFALTDEQRAEINVFYSDEYENVIQGVQSGELLLLPSNLHILATMNTSDQSLFPIDSAFKRRWEWEYVPIRNANKGWVIAVNGKEWDWWTFLERINEKIGSVTESEDKKLGYFFAKPSDNHTISAETFVSKVIFYLWNDVFKDYGFSDKEFLTVDGQQMTFPNFYETEISSQRVNEALVAQFLTNVAGEPLSTSSADEDIENNETITDTEEA